MTSEKSNIAPSQPAVGQPAMPPKSNTLWRLLTDGYDWDYVAGGHLSEHDRSALETKAKNIWAAICAEASMSSPVGDMPAGYALVPIEPTPAMRKAAADGWLDCDSKMILNKASAAIRAAIAASPTAALAKHKEV